MAYTNSPLVTYKRITSNKSKNRKYGITRITPHCYVGQVTAKQGCDYFANTTRDASSNYVIGYDGSVGLSVDEKDRAWTSSSSDNDNRAITIECACNPKAPYNFTDACYNKLIDLCVDICKRNGKTKLLWLGSESKTKAYNCKNGEMLLSAHRWFASTACPGDWMYSRMDDLAKAVTEKLQGKSNTKEEAKVEDIKYQVQVGVFKDKKKAEELVNALKEKGFDAIIKTEGKEVTQTSKPATTKKSNKEIAKEIVSGKCSDSRWSTWGNGQTRIDRLKAAGYDPNAIQKEVNKLL